MKDSPCHGCEHRYPACHGSCELYKDWRKPLDKMNEHTAKGRDADNMLSDGRYRGWRMFKRK